MSQLSFRRGPARVSVPATSANLGPGFDCLGLALDIRDHLEGEIRPEGLVVEVSGEGADDVPLDENHLVIQAMRVAFKAMDATPPGLHLTCTNAIPHARGLGSSSAAIVGGMGLARALVDRGPDRLDDDALFQLAANIEGHPDNVAPAVFGGFVICGRDDDGFYAIDSPVHQAITGVAFVPPYGLSTEAARGLLPDYVPHGAAAADAGRAALLVAALTARPDQLWRGTADYLHQEYRRDAMPETIALIDDLRTERVAAYVSGAGPTVLALCASAEDEQTLLGRVPEGWQARRVTLDANGLTDG